MDLIRDGGDQAAQEVPAVRRATFWWDLDEGKLRRSVDGDEQVELTLRSLNLSVMSMCEIANRIGLEFAFGQGFAFHLRQPGDPVALQTPVKG